MPLHALTFNNPGSLKTLTCHVFTLKINFKETDIVSAKVFILKHPVYLLEENYVETIILPYVLSYHSGI